jgi:hypothetical protein
MEEPMSNTPKEHREPITELLVLAALDRGERHRGTEAPGVPIWEILEHLDAPKRTKQDRATRAVLHELEASGAIKTERRRSVSLWVMTKKGAGWLRRARRAGKGPVLPESPQHRLWREAQEIAELEMSGLRQTLTSQLQHGQLLLSEPERHVSSDAWFDLSDRLERSAWMIGSASHCRWEWQEPNENQPDKDTRCDPGDEQLTTTERKRLITLRSSRRNLRRWDVFPDDQGIRSTGRSKLAR